jgi:hypothetical protein
MEAGPPGPAVLELQVLVFNIHTTDVNFPGLPAPTCFACVLVQFTRRGAP